MVAKEVITMCGAIKAHAMYAISKLNGTLIPKMNKDLESLIKIAPNS